MFDSHECEWAINVFAQDGGARLFYALAACSMIACWAAMSLAVRGDFHGRGRRASVTTRPSWLPSGVMLWLSAHHSPRLYMALCHGAPLALAAAACAPAPAALGVRLLVASVVSLYQLAEAALTHSHRDFASMYTCLLYTSPSPRDRG